MMVVDLGRDLVSEAEAAFTRVTTHPTRYIALATEILDASVRSSHHESAVVAMRALAWAKHAVLDNAGAKALLDRAVRLAERHGLRRRLGEVLVTRAVALHELGRRGAAMRDLRRAEPLVAADERPDLLMQQALLHHSAGRLGAAVELYERVLADDACPPIIWVKAANNIGNALTDLGRPRSALVHLNAAVERARDLGPLLLGVVTNSVAWASFYAGDVSGSMRRFAEAAPLYRAAGISLGEHYMDYSDALVDLLLVEEAYEAARSAVDDFDKHDARLMAAEARMRCARLALALGDAERASEDADAAVRDLRLQRRAAWVARATVIAVEAAAAATRTYPPDALRRLRAAATTLQRLGLRTNAVQARLAAGRAALALGRPAAARRHLAAAAASARGQWLLVRLWGHVASALLHQASGSPAAVLRHSRAGLADLARHRAAIPSVELRVLAAGHGAELGDHALRALLPAASAGRILNWIERTRAASLLAVQPPVPEVEEDVTALRGLEREIKAARRERGEDPPELLARYAMLEARIRRRSWGRDGVTEDPHDIPSVADLRRLLDGSWLVEYASVDGRAVAVVVEPRRTRLVDIGPVAGPAREVESFTFAVRRMLRGGRLAAKARAAADDALAALRVLLVEPLDVPAGTPLVVIPSGQFMSAPWSPLTAGPVAVAPSATFWARSRRQPAADTSRVALVAGPGLPGAAREVANLRDRYPNAAAVLPPDSTVEATIDLVRHADIAHLACHGRLRADNPLFSALELSDGSLTLHEMFSRGVAPHRVILAACDSGVERSYKGGEMLGFVSTMMARGTAGLVTPGLPIPDGASVDLMTALHDAIRGGASLADALYRACTAVGAEDPETYVAWCGLTAYGAA
jgi:tetratricopeptide (TPR) repeat protein